MPTWVMWVVLGVIVIALVAWFMVSIRKNKANAEKNKQDDRILTEVLNKTQQHLKYKRDIEFIYLVSIGIRLFCMLTLVFLFFVPIFQIKVELYGAAITTVNFSSYDNYVVMREAGVSTALCLMQFTVIIIAALIVLVGFISFIIEERKAFFDGDNFSFKAYKNIRIYNLLSVRIGGGMTFFIMCLGIASQIGGIFFIKDAEYPNNFVLCNAVSGYIAFPIICFILAAGLIVLNIYLQKKLKNNIKNEVVVLHEKEKEDTNEDCD